MTNAKIMTTIAYLTASEEKFDVIMVDAYQDITIPFQLSSVEFFTQVQRHLKPGGVMVVNLNMTSREDGSINQYLCDTMASVFAYTYLADVPGNTNTEVFCTNAPGLPERFAASRAALTDGDGGGGRRSDGLHRWRLPSDGRQGAGGGAGYACAG